MHGQPPGPTGPDIFEILVREHADMLTAYLRSVLDDTSSVDDLFQETMIVAWRRLADYDRSRPFGPWLRGIARNIALAHFRRRAAQPVWCSDAVLETIDRRFEEMGRRSGDTFRDRVERLLDCITRLPDGLRRVVEFAYGRGMLLRQIAISLDEQEEAIKKRAQRARKLLLDCLTTEEVGA